MTGISSQTLEFLFHVSTYAAFVLGGLSVTAALISAFSGYEVSDRVQKEAEQRISAATAQAELAKTEAAKANEKAAASELERVKMLKELQPRTITVEQAKAIGAFVHTRLRTLTIVFTKWDDESSNLAMQLVAAIQASGTEVPLVMLDVPQGSSGIILYDPNFPKLPDMGSSWDMDAVNATVRKMLGPLMDIGVSPTYQNLFPQVDGPVLYVSPRSVPFGSPGFRGQLPVPAAAK